MDANRPTYECEEKESRLDPIVIAELEALFWLLQLKEMPPASPLIQ